MEQALCPDSPLFAGVTAAELPDYVERLVRRWIADRDGAESFTRWLRRAEEAQLR